MVKFPSSIISITGPTHHFLNCLWGHANYSITTDSGHLFPGQQSSRLISRVTTSDETFNWASNILHSCSWAHRRCNLHRNSKLPTRVLDIGLSHQTNELGVRLLEASNDFDEYACLSHCWGTVRPIVITRENLATYRKQIPWEDVPRTFQDAVTITRKFGMRYIWIDSLCIVQDD